VNPNETEVLGERAYPSLSAVPGGVDVVNVFRESAAVPDIAREAALIGARGLWLQLGVVSDEGVKIAEAAGMDVIEDRCIKTEHARYGD
jgi:predicted CoA-binding protein